MIYLISDVHGNIEGLMRALEKHRIIDKHGNRQLARKHKVISIGDLANCVEESRQGDFDCLNLVGRVIDKLIIGNHEFPYFDSNNSFAGFHHYSDIHEWLFNLKDEGLIIPAMLKNKTLISHAGVSKQMLSVKMSAEEIAYSIFRHWDDANYGHSWFSSVGRYRGGRSHCGGILWCDFHEEFQPTSFPQIVGHSSSGGNVKMKGNAICIDVGAKNVDTEPFILEVR